MALRINFPFATLEYNEDGDKWIAVDDIDETVEEFAEDINSFWKTIDPGFRYRSMVVSRAVTLAETMNGRLSGTETIKPDMVVPGAIY